DFRIEGLLGAGSFARVFLATQLSLDREVALKISTHVGQEARTMAHLEHDHIVKVFSESVDAESGLYILCMQYVPGVGLERAIEAFRGTDRSTLSGSSFLDLADRLAKGVTAFNPAAMKDRDTLTAADYLDACLWIGIKLADALAYAHVRGVLHL